MSHFIAFLSLVWHGNLFAFAVLGFFLLSLSLLGTAFFLAIIQAGQGTKEWQETRVYAARQQIPGQHQQGHEKEDRQH